MESSKSIGEAEECESSESGWTMYIGSPMGNTEDYNGEGEVDEKVEEESYDKVVDDFGKDGDSDDSMASDASSRPVDVSKIGDGKCFEENKVVGKNVLEFKKPDGDDVEVKKNVYESRKNKNLGKRLPGTEVLEYK